MFPNQYRFFRGNLGAGDSVTFADTGSEGWDANGTAGVWVVRPEGKGEPQIFRALNGGGGWGYWQQSEGGYVGTGISMSDTDPSKAWNSYVADVDGDGAPNLVGREDPIALKRLTARREGIDAASITTLPISEPDGPSRKYIFADVTGDGLEDAIQLATSAFAQKVAENTGNGFKQAVTRSGPLDANVTMSGNTKWKDLGDPGVRVLDFDGDGRDDLLLVDDGRTRDSNVSGVTRTELKVLLSRSSGFVKRDIPIALGQHANGEDVFPANANSNWLLSQLVDINGDGLKDIALVRNGVLEVHVRQGKSRDLLIGVTDGMGLKRNVNYEPMSNHAMYFPGSRNFCEEPHGCAQNGPWVVESHRLDNGLAAGQNTTRYKYSDFRYDRAIRRAWVSRPCKLSSATKTAGFPHNVSHHFELGPFQEMTVEGDTVRIYPGLEGPTTTEEVIQTVELGSMRRTPPTGRTR